LDAESLKYIYISDICVKYRGYTPKEYYNFSSIKETFTPDSYNKALQVFNDVVTTLKTGDNRTVEAVFEAQHYTK